MLKILFKLAILFQVNHSKIWHTIYYAKFQIIGIYKMSIIFLHSQYLQKLDSTRIEANVNKRNLVKNKLKYLLKNI